MKNAIRVLEKSAYALLLILISGLLFTGVIGVVMMILALVGARP